MKKFLASVIMSVMLILTIQFSAQAQRKVYYYKDRSGRVHRTYQKPSFYRRHRNAINIGAGTAGGAILGGLIGGKRGAGVGALAGGGGSALYTYKLNKKKRRYVNRRN